MAERSPTPNETTDHAAARTLVQSWIAEDAQLAPDETRGDGGPSLAALQAEWRETAHRCRDQRLYDRTHAYEKCADALDPFIAREAEQEQARIELAESIGLCVDMLDVDRLRNWAQNILAHGADISHWASVPFVVATLQTLATNLEHTVHDVGLLRAEVAAFRTGMLNGQALNEWTKRIDDAEAATITAEAEAAALTDANRQFVAPVNQLATEITVLRRERDALRKYAQHKSGCPKRSSRLTAYKGAIRREGELASTDCTCGLEAALRSSSPESKG